MTFTLETLPLSTNNLYAHNGRTRYLVPKAKHNKESLAWEVRNQHRGAPLSGSLAVSVTIYWPTHRNHDVDNIKVLLDACTGILWDDDGQIVDLDLHKRFDKKRPRVEMTVTYA